MTRYISQLTLEGFAMIGMLLCAAVVVIFLLAIIMRANELVIFHKKRYKDKHFTKNPPKLKCYCIQCEYWETSDIDRNTALCRIWDKWTSKDESCMRGRLRTEQGYKDEKWRIEKQKEWEENNQSCKNLDD